MRTRRKLMQTALLAAVLLMTWLLPLFGYAAPASAISTDYPPQLMNIAVKDNSAVLTENGTADNAALSVKALGSDLSQSWRFDRVGADSNGTFFKICNAQSGRLLTPQNYSVTAGTKAVIYGSESAKSQHWFVVPVKNDRLGNGLYYKIVNYENTNLALTSGASGMTLETYSGADSQLWLLNADGLQGFAGYCKDDTTGQIKAADIGGLFGEVVEVTTFDDLKKYATSDTPYTIVVTKDLSVTDLNLNGERYMCQAGRIYVHSNKTIIGSYAAHTLFNVQFCTSSKSGTGNNLIIKNFESRHDAESNNNDSIQFYFGSGQNIWADHITFTGHNNYGYAPKTQKVDEDKFMAVCYDADYCTVSDCSFGAHKYGVLLGYPADDANTKAKYNNFPRMSLIANKFNDTNTRGPGLMRWGYFHSLNNYVNKFSMAYTVISECKIFAENCFYENGGNVICDWDKVNYIGYYSETGSTFSGCNRTKQGGDSNSTAQACNWRPASNYSYVSKSAADAKSYCSSFSGCQSGKDNMMYLRYASKGIPSAGWNEQPSGPSAASFTDGALYRFRNVNSQLYMQIAGGKAENGANIQQWGTSGDTVHDIWRLIDAGGGYYYIASALDDNMVLDVAGRKADNGTNIDLYQKNDGTNQQFMFTMNADGSYKIRTRISGESSAVEIQDGLRDSGANVQQWEINGANCQDWELIPASLPLNGRLVKSLVVYDDENAADWKIAPAAANGGAVFGDRDFTFTSLPETLTGAEQIMTACDSKNAADDLASFTAAADITVYAVFDTRVTSLPAWLSDYTQTAMTAASSNDVSYTVFAKDYKAGERVTLGTNGMTGSVVNYAVFVTETETKPLTGDVNDDGAVNVADAVTLVRWLICDPEAKIPAMPAADLNADGRVTAADLSLLKQLLLA